MTKVLVTGTSGTGKSSALADDGLRRESNGLLPRDELLKYVDHPMTA